MQSFSLLTPQIRSEISRPLTIKSDNTLPAVAKLMQDEDAFGSALYIGALQVLTAEELSDFAPKTIRLELKDALRLQEIPQDNFDQLMAVNTAVATDLFYRDVPAFIEICNILSGNPTLAGVFDPADVFEMAWGVAEIELIDGRDDDDIQFSEEVRGYMGMMLQEEGFFTAPGVLRMADMPLMPTPAEVTSDADLLPAMIERDRANLQEVQDMLLENTRKFVSQVEPIVGKLNSK